MGEYEKTTINLKSCLFIYLFNIQSTKNCQLETIVKRYYKLHVLFIYLFIYFVILENVRSHITFFFFFWTDSNITSLKLGQKIVTFLLKKKKERKEIPPHIKNLGKKKKKTFFNRPFSILST